MNKILACSRDTLFRVKLLQQLAKLGTHAVCAPRPARLGDYLLSGEFSLLVADIELFTGAGGGAGFAPVLPPSTRQRWGDLRFILTGAGAPEQAGPLASDCPVPLIGVEKEHLLYLLPEILAHFCPQVLGSRTNPFGEDERRHDPRVHSTLRAFVGDTGSGTSLTSRTVDLSTSGARVATRDPLGTDDLLPVRILLPTAAGGVEATARVIWTETAGIPGTFFSGLFFHSIAETDRFTLASYTARERV